MEDVGWAPISEKLKHFTTSYFEALTYLEYSNTLLDGQSLLLHKDGLIIKVPFQY